MNERQSVSCDEVEILMQDYLDGYLLPSQRSDLDGHLADCPGCRRELLLMKKLEEELEGSIPVEVPSALGDEIGRRLQRGFAVRLWYQRALRVAGTGLAAALVAFVIALVAHSPFRGSSPGREVEIVFHSAEASAVNLAGDFNDWDVASHPMKPGRGGVWRLTLRLEPGLYQYNFYVDHGFWAEDPGSPTLVSDGFGGRNALIYVEG